MDKKFTYLTKKETDQVIIKIVDTLLDPFIVYSGPHRKKQWEKGWSQNLEEDNLIPRIPRYFGKYDINRLNGRFIKALDKNYEIDALYSIVDSLAEKYLKKAKDIYEFGCGTGHILWRVFLTNTLANYCGLDWTTSSQKLVKELGFKAYKFDFFNPNKKLRFAPNSAVYTVAALEQTGTNYKKFVSYLLKNKPSIVVHIEPIEELLDPTNLLDNLSIKYFKKRHYLSGYLTYLRKLEKSGKIKIHEAYRTNVGSMFIEGYSVVVWSVKNKI